MSQYIMTNLFAKDAFAGWKDVYEKRERLGAFGWILRANQKLCVALAVRRDQIPCVQFSERII